MRNLWAETDLPLLRWAGETLAVHKAGVFVSLPDTEEALAAGIVGGESDTEMISAIRRLDAAGYLSVRLSMAGGSRRGAHVGQLTERGLRAVGAWPPDDAYLALVQVLEERIADPDMPPDDRGRLRRALDGFLGVGRTVGTEVAAAAINRAAGLS